MDLQTLRPKSAMRACLHPAEHFVVPRKTSSSRAKSPQNLSPGRSRRAEYEDEIKDSEILATGRQPGTLSEN